MGDRQIEDADAVATLVAWADANPTLINETLSCLCYECDDVTVLCAVGCLQAVLPYGADETLGSYIKRARGLLLQTAVA